MNSVYLLKAACRCGQDGYFKPVPTGEADDNTKASFDAWAFVAEPAAAPVEPPSGD